MPLWIAATLFAAFMQNLRFLLQRHLKVTTLSTGGATLARFLFGAPLAAFALGLYALATGAELPPLNPAFWVYVLSGGIAQIIATMCVVALFAFRNFAVGITLKKTEVMLSAAVGLMLLGDAVSLPVLVAIAIGFLGVLFLSDPPKSEIRLPLRNRIFNVASGYGLASGALFAVSAVAYRGATLQLASEDAILRAALTLTAATASQLILLGAYLLWREPGQLGKVAQSWRVTSLTGLTSIFGSLGWFTALALQTAAYVKALGQVELVFSFLFSVFFLREKTSGKEIIGLVFIICSVLLIFVGSLR